MDTQTHANYTERRRSARYTWNTKTEVTDLTLKNSINPERGIARDLSALGAFIVGTNHYPKGSLLKLTIDLKGKNQSKCRLHATGEVVRLDKIGMAIDFIKTRLVRHNPHTMSLSIVPSIAD